MYKVYVKTNAEGDVLDINSEIFLSEKQKKEWTVIDQGNGDRYAHAQGNYIDGPLYDIKGRPRYKLQNGAITRKE